MSELKLPASHFHQATWRHRALRSDPGPKGGEPADNEGLRSCLQTVDFPRQRRLPTASDHKLFADRAELAAAQRVRSDGFVPVDNVRQFPARSFENIDYILGFVEVLAKCNQGMTRASHQTTPHPALKAYPG